MTDRRPYPLLVIVALFALLVTGCVSEPGDYFTQALQICGALVLCYCALMIGRAIAARIAGDNADAVLGMALISITLPPLPRRKEETDQEGRQSTEDTSTPKDTEGRQNTAVSTLGSAPDTLKLTAQGGDQVILTTRITDDEKSEIESCRRNAIALLNKCVMYYRDKGEVDTGRIPRHKDLGMGSETRGPIVDTLWYSGFCSKGSTGTQIHPEYGNCRELMGNIINRKPGYRVYPNGYHERKQAIMDSAVNALPESTRA